MPASADKKKAKAKGKKDEKSEEDEKLRLEREEAARLEAIRKEKEEQLRKETEALINCFQEAKENMVSEAEGTKVFFKEKEAKLLEILSNENEAQQWKSFTSCSTLPDMRSSKLINNFISCWREEETISEDHSFDRLKSQLRDIEQLCDGLMSEYCTSLGNGDLKRASNYEEHLLAVRQAIYDKWNKFSMDIIQYFDYFPRESAENLQLEFRGQETVLGIWANMSKNPRFKTVEFDHGNIALQIPKPISLASLTIRVLYDTSRSVIHQFQTDHGVINSDKRVLGGVLFLDLFEIPESPKSGNGWTMRQMTEIEQFVSIDYPFLKNGSLKGDSDDQNNSSSTEALNDKDSNLVYQVGVKIPVKPGTYVDVKSLQALCWDSKSKKWTAEGFSDVLFDEGFISFKTINFKPTIICHDSYCQFPFTSWSLKPSLNNEIVFQIQGKIHELELLIKDDKCRLIKPLPNSEVFENRLFSPAELLQILSYYGYNFSCPISLSNVNPAIIKRKNPDCESPCLESLSILSQVYEITSSPNNRQAPVSCAIFRARQLNSSTNEFADFAFDVHYPVGDVFYQAAFEPEVSISQENKFILKLKQGSVPHSTVLKHLTTIADDSNKGKIMNADPIVSKTVFQTLKSVNPFSSS